MSGGLFLLGIPTEILYVFISLSWGVSRINILGHSHLRSGFFHLVRQTGQKNQDHNKIQYEKTDSVVTVMKPRKFRFICIKVKRVKSLC
jgi:hypothetical protein